MLEIGRHNDVPISAPRIFYERWIVVVVFLNLFYNVGVIYYRFSVFYPSLVAFFGFTRAQVTQGFLMGFIVVGLPFGYFASVLIDQTCVPRFRFISRAIVDGERSRAVAICRFDCPAS